MTCNHPWPCHHNSHYSCTLLCYELRHSLSVSETTVLKRSQTKSQDISVSRLRKVCVKAIVLRHTRPVLLQARVSRTGSCVLLHLIFSPRLSATVGHADLRKRNDSSQIRVAVQIAAALVRPPTAQRHQYIKHLPLVVLCRRSPSESKAFACSVFRKSATCQQQEASVGSKQLHEDKAAFWYATRRLLCLHSS